MKPRGRLRGVLLLVAAAALPGLLLAQASEDKPGEVATRVGDATCLECHEQFASAWRTSRHNYFLNSERVPEAIRGCEGCHGPGSQHLEDENFHSIRNEKNMTGLAAAKSCLQCHSADIRVGPWLETPHAAAGLNCASCHEVHHEPGGPGLLKKAVTETCLSCHKSVEPELRLNSHHPVLEGRLNCADCHDPHTGKAATRDLLKNGDDRCLRCHMEKRGPFVFEHQTSAGTGDDGCLTCHRAHGSPNPKLQEYFGRGTCLQCHADIAADPPHRPRTGDCWSAGCHNRIHGSNRDRLFFN